MRHFFYCGFCEKSYEPDPFSTFCRGCGEPLLIRIEHIKTVRKKHLDSLERYKDFLPLEEINPRLNMGEGNTPLIKCSGMMEKLRLPPVYVKNEMLNPTGSFKDRGTRISVQKAVEFGIKRIGTVSTGNMAASTAAYGARAGIKTQVLIKADIPSEKMTSSGVHGARLIQVEGDYGELFRKSFEIGKKHRIYFMNSVDPYRIEGYKLTGFEIFEKLDFRRPVYIFAPVSSGGHLIGLIKSFQELQNEGLIHNFPVFVGVQSKECAPLAGAFDRNENAVKRLSNPRTAAQSISNPDPPGGNLLLKWIRKYKGRITSVPDRKILEAQRILAEKEGLFVLPASAAAASGVIHWHSGPGFPSDAQVVMVATGLGLKNIKVIDSKQINLHRCRLKNLDKVFS